MGVDLGDVVPRRATSLEELRGKVVAVDAANTLYQFLSSIRQPDGTPLKDHEGRVTSHLSGLLYRGANLAEAGVLVCYVFDGRPPELKADEIQRRRERKERAEEERKAALERGDLATALTKAAQTSRLSGEMVDQAKALLDALGIPHVTAPSEGEAQAAHLVARGDAWASASQDYDSLLLGAPRLVRNLTVSGRRKLPGRDAYVDITPELVVLEDVLQELDVTREELVVAGILVGTDFNEGVKGVGAKTALKLVGKHGDDLDAILEELEVDIPLAEPIRALFLEPDVTDDVDLTWGTVDEDAVVELLVGQHAFSEERVRAALPRYRKLEGHRQQRSLDAFF